MADILESKGIQGLRWRMIGPYRGSRVVAVAGHPTDPMTFYFGGCGGGVWKTTDGGFLWDNVSDGFFKRSSVGAIAVSTSSPEIIYAGMGECSNIHGQTHGDGVYRSADSGRTWQHMGLEDTHCIGKIRIHPTNPDLVYVAAWGHRFGPSRSRGVYRSKDGGKTWEQVLFRGLQAGAIDITMNPQNPNVLYAAFWHGYVTPWTHVSGGPDSSIYKSVDGGDTWTELTHNPGLPTGLLGKIGITVSPARPDRIWALIEHADQGGVYRSDDGGDTWSWMDNNRSFLVRASYFCHIVADPQNPDIVYMPNRKVWKSVDGGRSFVQLNTPYVDQHDLWVAPDDSQRMIIANDGGAAVSFNGGKSWSTLTNQPTAEIYRLAVDNHFPYRIYGSQQDNSTLCLPSRTERGPISQMDWYDIGGGESGFIAVRADNPNIVFSSDLPGLGVTRYDHSNFQIREVGPWADPVGWDYAKLKYRFNWAVPVVLSPHDPGILYVAGNVVFRSYNDGDSWEVISPDLTKDDPTKKMPSGGPVMREDSSADQYANITSIAESPFVRGELWAGTNDGLVQMSRDDGKSWQNVTPKGFPEWGISQIEPSSHAAGKAYVAASGHYSDDFTPYLFVTEDYGQTWTLRTSGIPDGYFLRVVREDPQRAGLLYAGTEAGIFYSLDDGRQWQPLQNNLAITSVYDILVKNADLVVATHGRGMWILDDISPLRQMTTAIADAPVTLFAPEPAYRVTRQAYGLNSLNAAYFSYAANNPPSGIIVHYHLKEAIKGKITLELLDANGTEIQTVTNDVPAAKPIPVGPYTYHMRGGSVALKTQPAGEPETGVKWGALTLVDDYPGLPPAGAGINRFVLPIQYRDIQRVAGQRGGGITDPLIVPGMYQVRLTIGDQTWTQPVEVLKDPRVATTPEEFQAQFDLMWKIREQVDSIHRVVQQCRDLRQQLIDRMRPLQEHAEALTLIQESVGLQSELTQIEYSLIQPDLNVNSGELDGSHYEGMPDGKLEALGYKVGRSDNAPPQQAYAMYDEFVAETVEPYARFEKVIHETLPAFNQHFQEGGWSAIVL
ncbi:MAG: glycosyl hydrolase [Chloroflexi bacterium]|nr:glycosyl hydrolase [Chloroflexota bacterium]MCC6897174.1 glycosyl hydrolase [Anaerolineae bacterium]